MTEWSVLVEVEGDEAPDEEALGALLDVLADVAGAAAATDRTWSARVTVDADDAGEAAFVARDLVLAAGKGQHLAPGPVIRLEVVRQDVLEVELDRPQLPELLGTQEVTKRLDVSRQRLHELRSQGRFPLPVYELAAGPLWLGPAVDAFLERWDRKPGRPASVSGSRSGGRVRSVSGSRSDEIEEG